MSWFDNNEMWEVFYDCMFDRESFAVAKTQCQQIINLVDHPVKSVLDMACGPGRHVLGFAAMNIETTGVDLSGYLLNQAANQIDHEKLSANLVHSDLLAYQPNNKFDLITNLFTSFGYYNNPAENQQVLNNAYQWLNPKGTFIIDTFGKEQAAHAMEPVHCTEYDNGDLRFERPLLVDNMNIYSNEWILVRDNQAHRWEYEHFVYTAQELTAMLLQAGFKNIEIYGSLNKADYDLSAERLVAVARK
ncbi:class I SAM-dependent methyltransferase [Marinicella litoralis]|uniref:Ubiquinone/menaquinone biosynthesis C-methylase UbiE n=1 Tax=Marinicella litoralis TaxID=644220 RepID=A0A4R6XZ39_9GAMM|nr:class I SAM-dependent methyltransferase [Marinicella litoralis]TDR23810.1 ubiquinone/menaquinone biosynthesis C-methylase UbiE [Marinicella litoralis]